MSQGLLAINPPYALVHNSHYCKSCRQYFNVTLPKVEKPIRKRMTVEEVFTSGPMPPCPLCGVDTEIVRLIVDRPPYASPLLMFRGQGARTGMASFAKRGIVKIVPKWPCVDKTKGERKCTHYCSTCKHAFRETRAIPPPDFPQVCTASVAIAMWSILCALTVVSRADDATSRVCASI